ncbi:MAG: hypothetical protein M3261_00990 [Thermoproteota archaeon]|nr:hypothetical protein [Thermoproteota archaeon]
MLTLPNTTKTISTTSNGSGLIPFVTSSGFAKETIRTEDGQSATATFYEIVQFEPKANGGAKGIVTAIFQTKSNGALAPLNGMIAAGIDDMPPNGESHITLWRWESGIKTSQSLPFTVMQGNPPQNEIAPVVNAHTTTTASEASQTGDS